MKTRKTSEGPFSKRPRRRFATAVCLAAVCLLLSCSHHYHTDRSGYLKPLPDEKNIITPEFSSDFTEKLKEALRAKGWNTLEPEAPAAEPGTPAVEKTRSPEAIPVPYTLEVTSKFISKCVTWDNFVEYKITVMDNRTGKKLFTMEGQRCDSKVVHQFMSMLNAKGPS